jgi:hypothetical protein
MGQPAEYFRTIPSFYRGFKGFSEMPGIGMRLSVTDFVEDFYEKVYL